MRRWDPFSEVEAVRREIDRTLNNFYGSSRQPAAAFLPGRAARAYPLINLAEDKDAYFVEALAPGVDPQQLDVSVVRNTLTIAGEKRAPGEIPPESFHRTERAAGRFVRSVDLPAEVDATGVQARYTDGLLSITLPKAEQAKPRQIQVAVA